MVNVMFSAVHNDTLLKYPQLAEKLKDFIRTKADNPIQKYGSSDATFNATGPLGKLKIKHAHLSQDVSVLYRIVGSPPTIYIYGLFSHKDTGTGNTAQPKIQKSLASKLQNQFPELMDSVEAIDFDEEYEVELFELNYLLGRLNTSN